MPKSKGKQSKQNNQSTKPTNDDDDEFLNNAIKEVQIETKLLEEENSKKVNKTIPKQNNKCMHCNLEHDITLNFPYLQYSPCCNRYISTILS
jgi:hypothetical protein